jgi:hypothetical protein
MRNDSSLDFNKFFNDLNLSGTFKIEEDLGNGFVRLKISESDRRQALQDIRCVEDIIIELLRNSRDAGAENIFIATKKIRDRYRKIYVIDDGKGIPEKFHNLIFQSRVTSKLEDGIKDQYGFHGRGMALFSIKLNADRTLIVFSAMGQGTSISTGVDLEKIPEKKDQSLLPKITCDENGPVLTGGTGNIIKTLLEFSLQNPKINLFYGSPTQIISTMIKNLTDSQMSDIKNPAGLKFDDFSDTEKYFSEHKVKVCRMPYFAATPAVLDNILLRYFDMSVSLRGLQRIIYNEIDPVKPLNNYFDILSGTGKTSVTGNKITKKNPVSFKQVDLKMHDENKLAGRFKDGEISYIINVLRNEILKISDRHFIVPSDHIEVKKLNNRLDISIFFEQKK